MKKIVLLALLLGACGEEAEEAVEPASTSATVIYSVLSPDVPAIVRYLSTDGTEEEVSVSGEW